ncbi:MAG: arsenate reductase ArsC [Gammaproteobacteria bacterium]|nr:arsenate reductase ArsC [Gammaproteobacteria bacterium]
MTKRVLFLCTGNACRSQMAHGWANALALPDVEFYSAGIQTHGVNPHAITVMAEAGIDISDHKSQLISEFDTISFDVIFSVCDHANKNCPTVSGAPLIICHQFDDPPALAKDAVTEQQALDCYRQVRDQIKAWIALMPSQLNSLAP